MLTRSQTQIAIGLIAALAFIFIIYSIWPKTDTAQDRLAAETVVTEFGGYLKSISLLQDEEDLKREIQNNYGRFVTDDLLTTWRADPGLAPGRDTSSPWPDHIVVDGVAPQGTGYSVHGTLVMMSSAGNAGELPVTALVIKQDDSWRIAAFEVGAASSTVGT